MIQLKPSNRIVYAIDPGPVTSGVVRFRGTKVLESHSAMNNRDIELEIRGANGGVTDDEIAIEMIESYGMAVGKSVFRTLLWIGRFVCTAFPKKVNLIYRKDIKLFLCGTLRAKDANVRRAILDSFPETGGGKEPAVGTKKFPGPLYGVKSHAWSALAVALAYTYGGEEIVRKERADLW